MKKHSRMMLALALLLALVVLSVPAYAASGTDFSDTQTHWAKKAIERWSEMGVLNGFPDGTFRPNNQITACELCKIVNSVVGYQAEYLVASVPQNAWYAKDVSAMVARRILPVSSSAYEEPITREDAVCLIANAFGLDSTIGATVFADQKDISSYAKNSVETMHGFGYINGYPDRRFGPKESLTRAEVVTILDNVCSVYIAKPGTYSISGGPYHAKSGHVFVNSEDVTLELDGKYTEVAVGPAVRKEGSVSLLLTGEPVSKGTVVHVFSEDAALVKCATEGNLFSIRTVSNPRYSPISPALRADADPMERAGVALGSMLSYRKNLGHNTLPTAFGFEEYTNAGKNNLSSGSWGVESRADLLRTIIGMTYSGHNDSFLESVEMLGSMSAAELKEASEEDERTAYMIQETLEMYQKWGDAGIVCWDEFRVANLTQWGYAAGYISKEEAYALLEPVIAIVAEHFDTWEDAYDNYLDGYAWWSRTDITNGKERPRESVVDNVFIFFPDVFDDSLLTRDYSAPARKTLYEDLVKEALPR